MPLTFKITLLISRLSTRHSVARGAVQSSPRGVPLPSGEETGEGLLRPALLEGGDGGGAHTADAVSPGARSASGLAVLRSTTGQLLFGRVLLGRRLHHRLDDLFIGLVP